MRRALVVLAAVTALGGVVRAAPITMRMASVAPEGSAWAILLRDWARELETVSGGQVRVRWYFSGITGDELETLDGINKGHLDGVASGGMLCQRLAPTMRAVHIVGLFQSREEALYVLGRLKPRVDKELASAGFTNLGEAGFGTDVIYSRTPIRTLDDLRKARMWIWDLDDVYKKELPVLGLHAVPLPLEAALPAFEAGKLDGFIGIPSAALVFQWSSRARYFSDLRVGYLMGCLVITNTAFDPLPLEMQKAVHAASGRLMRHMEDMGEAQDRALLTSLFAKQGMHRIEVGKSFRSDFLDAARAARLKLGAALASPALLDEINGWLADYRSDHQ